LSAVNNKFEMRILFRCKDVCLTQTTPTSHRRTLALSSIAFILIKSCYNVTQVCFQLLQPADTDSDCQSLNTVYYRWLVHVLDFLVSRFVYVPGQLPGTVFSLDCTISQILECLSDG